MLGRDPSTCTLPLRAQPISKQHTAVSITAFHANSGRDGASIEALVWDMGSMNGTRKGRLKLTPHVRYALNEGDTLLVADIPCQYTSCGVSGGPGNTDPVVLLHPEPECSPRLHTEPECSLVPESDSDSDGERGRRGRWRNTLGMWRR